ncbi:hypothetical protein, partial [Salmonella sp. s54395]|uniref:hypothetical protein n=1 Tax=Salmonella sp. s54395 TaxID=3159664 RepID=UPI003981343A
LKKNITSGERFDSGEFDIISDGSLIINHVTLRNEGSFTVLKFNSQGDDPLIHLVDVTITVIPSPAFPVIDTCGSQHYMCFKELRYDEDIVCK